MEIIVNMWTRAYLLLVKTQERAEEATIVTHAAVSQAITKVDVSI